MDIQNMISNMVKVERAESMRTSEQITLGELIIKLELMPATYKSGEKDEPRCVRFEFGNLSPTHLMSWRGSYSELAIGYSDDSEKTHKEFLDELRGMVGKTLTGYKGGDFVMGKNTPVWIANYGNSGETAIVDVRQDDYYTNLITKQIPY